MPLDPENRRPAAWLTRFRVCLLLALAAAACGDPSGPRRPRTGSLAIGLDGLPGGVAAAVTVTGPNGFSQEVTGGTVLSSLVPGTYAVAARAVVTPLLTFEPATPSQTVSVTASDTAATALVRYTVTTGSMNVLVSGLPAGASPFVVVAGPDGFRDTVTATGAIGNLKPGIYQISSRDVVVGTSIYSPKPVTFVLAVSASVQPAAAVIGYYLSSGSLTLTVNGLPPGTAAALTMTGPDGFSRTLTGSTTLEGLLQGRYTVLAQGVLVNGATYAPSPTSLTITVAPGQTSTGNVNYTLATQPPGLNLLIDAIQVQQVVQAYGGTVPLVAGRDALFRVFVKATQSNASAPQVRVRLYDGTTLVSTTTVAATASGVPTTITEGNLASSWNALIPAAIMRPGLRVLADVDPANTVGETIENDNAYPSSGTPLALDVRQTSPVSLRLVPVMQSATGLTGNVSAANVDQFTDFMRRVFPLSAMNVDVRTPFTTNAPALDPTDANSAWLQVLSEINALRAADGSAAQYYGVVKTPYTSGIVGLGYVPGPASMGWDRLPIASETMAHELGHNFGRFHSPCGTNGTDINYPYAGGVIGVYGYDLASGTLRDPTASDLMGYCPNKWISDYTYIGILSHRAAQPSVLAQQATGGAAPRPGLLVWGRISNGTVVLEPAFEVVAPPRFPARQGRHRLELLGAAGESMLALSFDGERVADAADPTAEHFAFVVPLGALGNRAPARVMLSVAGRRSEVRSRVPAPGGVLVSSQRTGAATVSLAWADAPGRGVLVRDARDGAILAFLRGGRGVVRTTADQLDLAVSDGVGSVSRRVGVGQGGPPRR
jgi:hypothetical protein